MRKEEFENFVFYSFNNKSLSYKQRKKLNFLLVRDYFDLLKKGVETNENKLNTQESNSFVQISALNTSRFLSLFNDPEGLKYLTHDFDSTDDNGLHDLVTLRKQCQKILKEQNNTIPKSLLLLINGFVNGTPSWFDTYGNTKKSSIADKSWINWSNDNRLHPKNNENFCKEIMTFRSTVRMVSPLLKEMVDKVLSNTKLNVTTVKLDKADFYTNTFVIFTALKRILSMMESRGENYPNVSISYKRDAATDDILLRKIIITQEGSFSPNQLEDLISRLKIAPKGGDFGTIRNWLNGYCEWSVESKWDGIPARWNILKEIDTPEIEKMSDLEVVGFTHILTFYVV